MRIKHIQTRRNVVGTVRLVNGEPKAHLTRLNTLVDINPMLYYGKQFDTEILKDGLNILFKSVQTKAVIHPDGTQEIIYDAKQWFPYTYTHLIDWHFDSMHITQPEHVSQEFIDLLKQVDDELGNEAGTAENWHGEQEITHLFNPKDFRAPMVVFDCDPCHVDENGVIAFDGVFTPHFCVYAESANYRRNRSQSQLYIAMKPAPEEGVKTVIVSNRDIVNLRPPKGAVVVRNSWSAAIVEARGAGSIRYTMPSQGGKMFTLSFDNLLRHTITGGK